MLDTDVGIAELGTETRRHVTERWMPHRLVYGLQQATDPQVSPDGRRVVYSVGAADPATQTMSSQLWLCDIDGGHARQLTSAGKHNGCPRWSPDGAWIAFVSDRDGGSGIFVLPAAGMGEARQVTKHKWGVSGLAWSPDGSKLAYNAPYDPANPEEATPDPNAAPPVRYTERIDYKSDGRGYIADKRSHIFVVDVASGERRRVTELAVDHGIPGWSPDGTLLAYTLGTPYVDGVRLQILDLASGATRETGGGEGRINAWAWSPSGERIILADDPTDSDQHDLFVYELASGVLRQLTDDLPFEPIAANDSSSSNGIWWLDERQVLFHAVHRAASELHTLDVESGALEPVVQWPALNGAVSMDDARRYAVLTYTSFDTVGEVAVYDLHTGATAIITSLNTEALRDAPPANWERFAVERGEFTIDGFLLTPPDFDPSKTYPLVLDIHGGPQWYYGFNFWPWQQVLASHGFLVAFANPRGSSSYGRHFVSRVRQDWGGEDFKDLMAVVDALVERPYVDAERTGIHGYSYGGYMTSWAIGQTQRFKACVCGAPVFDFESFRGTSDIGFGWGETQFGGAPHAAKEAYAKHSPSEFAHNATTPTLIVHGEADERCPIGQGEQMFIALKQAGCKVGFARYPGADHLFLMAGHPAHREDYWTRLLDWMREHLSE
ncbi:MAG: hypothetical protein DCC58_08125 [Chloroflexi bacterium]|nr:MAG: hypothetical protein DCC58_08125 [Chloroflexota bacterium]